MLAEIDLNNNQIIIFCQNVLIISKTWMYQAYNLIIHVEKSDINNDD